MKPNPILILICALSIDACNLTPIRDDTDQIDKPTLKDLIQGKSVDTKQIYKLALKHVIKGKLVDAKTQREMECSMPTMSYYRLAGDYYRYTIRWELKAKRILLIGQGDMKSFEGAELSTYDVQNQCY